MITTPRFLMLLALLTPTAAGASLVPTQDATPKKDVAQDDAKRRPQGERKKGATTRDGKPVKGKVIDGKPMKGKPVKGKPMKKTDAKPDDELLNALDLDKLLNKSQEDMAAELRKQLEQGAKAQKVKDAKSKKSSSSSSSSKRKVVVNGETVVDEETKDGKPVNGKKPGKRPAVGKGKGKDKAKSSDSSSSSSSQIHRVVVINGKTVVDDLIIDGDAGSVDLGKLLKGLDLDDLLKDIDLDLPADVKDHVRNELKRQLDDMKKPAPKGKKPPVVVKKKSKAV